MEERHSRRPRASPRQEAACLLSPPAPVDAESLLAALVDEGSAMIMVFDREGVVQRVSPACAALVGLTPARLVGSPAAAGLPASMRLPLERTLLGEETMTEHRCGGAGRCPTTWVRARWQPLRDADGALSGGVLTALDITAEKDATRYRNYIETSPVAAAQSTAEGKLIYASPACAALFGYDSPEELISAANRSSIGDALWDDPAQRRRVVAEALAAHGRWVSTRARGKRKDGSTFVFELHLCRRQAVVSGEPYFFSFLQDVTEVTLAEEELERTGEMLREAEELAGYGGWEWDMRSGRLRASRGARAIMGIGGEEITLDEFRRSLVHPDDRQALAAALRRVLAGSLNRVELRVVRPDSGETRHVALYGRFVEQDADGRPTRMRGAVLDVTERVSVLAALSEQTGRLQRTLSGAIKALGATVEMRDPYTAGHEARVATLACAIARRLGWDDEAVATLWTAALLHDIGKLAVPAEILTKPSQLTQTEFQLMMTHAAAGRDILASIDFAAPIAEIVAQHHERLDGSGYPEGLSGDAILPAARILAVADVVEAMVSHRPYRPALPVAAATAELWEGAGTRYDAAAVQVCAALLEDGGLDFAAG